MKTGLVALVTLVAISTVAGCSGDGGGASKDAFVQDDGALDEPGTNPFFTSGEEETETEGTGDGGAQTNPPEPKATVVAEVKITTNKMKDGLFGKEYEKKLKAKGGSKEYTWSIVDGALPPGLALEGEMVQGIPTGVGDFNVTIAVADANDPAKTDSKAFTIRIEDILALNAFIDDGDSNQSDDALVASDPQTVAWGAWLIFSVEGHSSHYTWEVADSEKYKVGAIGSDRISVEPENRDADVTVQNLSVTVRDNIGSDEKTVTLSSVIFKGNPCKVPLAVTINNFPFKTEGLNTVTTTVEEPLAVAIKISGGVGPYRVATDYDYGFNNDGTCHWNPASDPDCKIAEDVDEDGSAVFTLTFSPRWTPGYGGSGELSVEDGCASPRVVTGTFMVDAIPPVEKVTDIRVVLFTGEIHDTGSSMADHGLQSSWMSILFSTKNLSMNVDEDDQNYDYEQKILKQAAGEAYYSLAECNDAAAESYSDRKCAEPRPVEAIEDKNETSVTSIKDISLLWHDHGDSDVDADIHLIIFYTKYRYAIYSDEGAVGNAFDNNVVEHTWRLDDISGSKGMLRDDKGNIWFERGAPNVDAEYDYLLLPSFMFGRALWDAEDEAAPSSGDGECRLHNVGPCLSAAGSFVAHTGVGGAVNCVTSFFSDCW